MGPKQNLNQNFSGKKKKKKEPKKEKPIPSLGHFFLSHMPWHLFICCSSAFQAMWPGSEADFLKHTVVWNVALQRFLASTLNARWVGNLQIELMLKDLHSNVGEEIQSSGKWPYSYLQELMNIRGKRELSSSFIKVTPLWLDQYLHGSVCSAVPVSKVTW